MELQLRSATIIIVKAVVILGTVVLIISTKRDGYIHFKWLSRKWTLEFSNGAKFN